MPPTAQLAEATPNEAAVLQFPTTAAVDVVAMVDQGLAEIETGVPSREIMIQRLNLAFTGKAVEKKGKFDYVAHETVTRRLNWATGFSWTHTVDEVWFREDKSAAAGTGESRTYPVVCIAQVTVSIPSLGNHTGFGVAAIQIGGGEDQYKGAISDGIKVAAKCFGVALHLYGADIEGVDPQSDETIPAAKPAAKTTKPAATTAAPLGLNEIRAGIGAAQEIIGAETIKTEMTRRFGVDLSSKMTEPQWRELYAWVRVQVDNQNKS